MTKETGAGDGDVLVDGPQLCTVPILHVGLVHLGLKAGVTQLQQDFHENADQGQVEGGHVPHLRVDERVSESWWSRRLHNTLMALLWMLWLLQLDESIRTVPLTATCLSGKNPARGM